MLRKIKEVHNKIYYKGNLVNNIQDLLLNDSPEDLQKFLGNSFMMHLKLGKKYLRISKITISWQNDYHISYNYNDINLNDI